MECRLKDTCDDRTSRLKDENAELEVENERMDVELKDKRVRCQALERQNADLVSRLPWI